MARWSTPEARTDVDEEHVFMSVAMLKSLRFTDAADRPLRDRRALAAKALDRLTPAQRAEVVQRCDYDMFPALGSTLAEFAVERYERN